MHVTAKIQRSYTIRQHFILKVDFADVRGYIEEMKTRIQVSISPVLIDAAKKVMAARGFDSFSEFLEGLIRQEMDRQQTVAAAVAAPPPPQKTQRAR